MALSPRKLKVGDLVIVKFGPRHRATTRLIFNPAMPLTVGKWYTATVDNIHKEELDVTVVDDKGRWVRSTLINHKGATIWADAIVVRKVSHA